MREFESGATRDDDMAKLDYEGFNSPLVDRCYAEYMHKHRTQGDGKLRPSDNWQKGIDPQVYMKSLCRHFMDLRLIHDGYRTYDKGIEVSIKEALCAVLFNTKGYLFEILKGEE